MPKPVHISGVIITYNEEHNIRRCLESLNDLVDEVVVVDSFSTDRTVSICKELGARVIQHEFEGHIQQKNYAMDQANYDCILSLDADECVSAEMRSAINSIKSNWVADGYVFNRFNNYCGKWLRFSWYPDRKLRLWDRRKGRWGGTNPHDRVEVMEGTTVRVKGDIHHYAYRTVEEHKNQVQKFAEIAAKSKFAKGKKANLLIHVILNPLFKFIKRYIFQFGLLDGYYGLVFSYNGAYLNFMKYYKLWKLNHSR